jgi:hypothetical protein
MNNSSDRMRQPGHEEKGFAAALKNLQPAPVALMLLGIGMLVYMLWVFFGGYSQTY